MQVNELKRVQKEWQCARQTDLSLPGQSVDLFESSPRYASFKNAVILLCINVERFLVDGNVILNLIHRRLMVAMFVWQLMLFCGRRLLVMVLLVDIEIMRR